MKYRTCMEAAIQTGRLDVNWHPAWIALSQNPAYSIQVTSASSVPADYRAMNKCPLINQPFLGERPLARYSSLINHRNGSDITFIYIGSKRFESKSMNWNGAAIAPGWREGKFTQSTPSTSPFDSVRCIDRRRTRRVVCPCLWSADVHRVKWWSLSSIDAVLTPLQHLQLPAPASAIKCKINGRIFLLFQV